MGRTVLASAKTVVCAASSGGASERAKGDCVGGGAATGGGRGGSCDGGAVGGEGVDIERRISRSVTDALPQPAREIDGVRIDSRFRSAHRARRAVWARGWVWPVDGGGICGSTRKLQLDHVEGWALGAETTIDSCRLLCAIHNDLHARALYGDAVMDRYARPKGAAGAEPVAGA